MPESTTDEKPATDQAISQQRLVRLRAKYAERKSDWEMLARQGATAPHEHLQIEAKSHLARVEVYEWILTDLEEIIQANV